MICCLACNSVRVHGVFTGPAFCDGKRHITLLRSERSPIAALVTELLVCEDNAFDRVGVRAVEALVPLDRDDRRVRLREALASARSDPPRVIAGDAETYEEVRYEGYGPNGVAIIVEAMTDNRNRTASNVRSYFTKNGGDLGQTGSVSFMFDRVGEINAIERRLRAAVAAELG